MKYPYSKPYEYTLYLADSENKRVIYKKEQVGQKVNFQIPVTAKSRPKIYVLKVKEEVVYVGYTSQPIGTRLRQGTSAKGLNGYHGYKWKYEDELELLVFVFNKTFSGKKSEKDTYRLYVEAIEAELVYIIRQNSKEKCWPKYQNEIHFNNDYRYEVMKSAEAIYGQIFP